MTWEDLLQLSSSVSAPGTHLFQLSGLSGPLNTGSPLYAAPRNQSRRDDLTQNFKHTQSKMWKVKISREEKSKDMGSVHTIRASDALMLAGDHFLFLFSFHPLSWLLLDKN